MLQPMPLAVFFMISRRYTLPAPLLQLTGGMKEIPALRFGGECRQPANVLSYYMSSMLDALSVPLQLGG